MLAWSIIGLVIFGGSEVVDGRSGSQIWTRRFGLVERRVRR